MAVALAALLWLIVAGDHLVERSLRVPLEFRNIAPDLELVGDPPTEVDVRLRGSSALLGRLEPRDIVAVLDLRRARPGSRMFHLRSDEVRAPYGVDVAQVIPGTLARGSRKVRPAHGAGRAGARRRAGAWIRHRPRHRRIRRPSRSPGPESRLKQLTGATTEPVAGQQAADTRVHDVVTVGITDSAVRLVQPQNATITVDSLPAPVERDLAGVPIRWRNLQSGLQRRRFARCLRASRCADGARRWPICGRHHRRVRGPLRSRSRPIQSSRPGGSVANLRRQRHRTRRR